jgi:trans-AT polyketide synthase, acyltransferase and oxidoreductase domains
MTDTLTTRALPDTRARSTGTDDDAPYWAAYRAIADLERACMVISGLRGVELTTATLVPDATSRILAVVPALPPERLGSRAFAAHHQVRSAYMTGAMANGIASEEMVMALAKAGFLASFGAAGLLPERIDRALDRFAREIPGLPFACNLIHSPSEQQLERRAVDLYLARGVACVEASAYMDLSPSIVRYRVAGLARDNNGRVTAYNRVIAKVSRLEVAERFMRPPPRSMVDELLAAGLVSTDQADLAQGVPMADDVTVEGDSGGHTDRRPLLAVLPAVILLRDRLQAQLRYPSPVRVGAAGGLGTPQAVWAAFAAGAAYVVTGSVNQACVESGASEATKALLAGASVADCDMAPAADMFELGVELQVLKKGTLFPMKARRLYEIYKTYDGIGEIPPAERHKLETQVFRRPLEDVWAETESYFERRDPDQLARARGNEKRRMALIFRWYLGMSSRWSNTGEPDRALDYQIWCGPAMGSFNEWAQGTYLDRPEGRHVVDVAYHLMRGAAFTGRVTQLQLAGVGLPNSVCRYRPAPLAMAGCEL